MKTETEINAEKAAKPRVDIVPPVLMLAAGAALGYGASKHGVPEGNDGFGTWRTPNTQQAEPLTHYACLMRHLLRWRGGEVIDPVEDGGSGLPHLYHAAAQIAILLDLLEGQPRAAVARAVPQHRDWEAELRALGGQVWSDHYSPRGWSAFVPGDGWVSSDSICGERLRALYPEIAKLVDERNGVQP